jgi:hypothetical protein
MWFAAQETKSLEAGSQSTLRSEERSQENCSSAAWTCYEGQETTLLQEFEEEMTEVHALGSKLVHCVMIEMYLP